MERKSLFHMMLQIKNFKVTAEGKTVEAKAGTTSATITL